MNRANLLCALAVLISEPLSAQQVDSVVAEPVDSQTQAAAVTSASVQLSRLFYTPAERDEVERARREPRTDGRGAELESIVTAERPPSIIRFDGIADRSPRGPVIWINGRALEERSAIYHHRLHIENGTLVLTDRNGRQARLSVGQLLNLDTGSILDTVPAKAIQAARK